MVRYLLVPLIWCLILPIVLGQVSFTASVSQQVLNQQERFRLVYELKDAAGQRFTPPSFKDFEVISGPNEGSNTTIINGQVSRSVRISYDLLALKPGKFVLEPARVLVNNKQVKSNTITITVNAVDQTQLAKGLNTEAEVQVRLNIPKDTVYVGEELRLEAEMISKVDIRTYSIVKALSTDGIRKEDLRNFSLYERKIKIDDEPFSARTIQAVSLFPNRPGTYSIGPVILQANVLVGERNRGFFFSPRTRPVDATSNTLELTVLPLPQPEAEGFIGAVGDWRFQGQYADLSEMTTADALTFRLFVQGQGDAGRLKAPELAWPEGWRAYPPETTTDHSVETDTGLVHTRVYEYTVAPVRGGTFNLRPQASYFSAAEGRYITWTMQPRTIAVTDVGTDIADEDGASALGLFAFDGTPKPAEALWIDQAWFWWLLGAMPIVLSLSWIAKQVNKKTSSDENVILKDPVAEGKRRLQKARASLSDPSTFYLEVREALQQYAHDRLGLPPSEQSPSKIIAAFAKTPAGEAQGHKFMEASALADRGLYGGGTDEEGRRTALAELEVLLSASIKW